MGSCCDNCAQAARETTCEPCAADVGALFGVARARDAGAAPPPPDTYTDATLSIIDEVLGSPLAPELAPVVRVTGLILELTASELLKGPSLLAGLIPEALSSALEAAGSMVELIPMLGEVIGVAVKFGGAPVATDDQRERTCLDNYVPPGGQTPEGGTARGGHGLGTGSAGTVVPADFFVSMTKTQRLSDDAVKAKNLGTYPSSIGMALRAMTEWDPGPEAVAALRKHFQQPNLGLPAAERARFRRLREAIESSWQNSNTDGGVALWPFYLDLIRREMPTPPGKQGEDWTMPGLGRLSPQYARFLSYYARGWEPHRLRWALAASVFGPGALPPNNDDNRTHCDRYDSRPMDAALAMVERWRLKIDPRYAPERAAVAKMVADGQKLLTSPPRRTTTGAGRAMMATLAASERLQVTTSARGGLARPSSASSRGSSSDALVLAAAAGGAALLLGGGIK